MRNLNSIYTKEKEIKMEEWRQGYNMALSTGNVEMVEHYKKLMLGQISQNWVDVHVRPTGMLRR